MILDDLEVIFFHPGKTGGSTIERVLGSFSEHAELLLHPSKSPLYGNATDSSDYVLRKKLMMGLLTKKYAVNGVWGAFLQHADIEMFERLMEEKTYDDYYKFAFVRNPFDRLLSAFFYNGIDKKQTFEDFIKCGAFVEKFESNFDKATRYTTNHFMEQHKYTHLNNVQYVDYIGRQENFSHDFHHVLSELNLTYDEEFPILAKSLKSRYYDNYTDAYDNEMYDIVHRIYELDFEIFHY